MDLFSYLMGRKKGGGGSLDTSDIRTVINMTGANLTSSTPFTDYPQALYSGYLNIIKDNNIFYDNAIKGTSSGYISSGLGLPLYEAKLTKESTQSGTPTPQSPLPIKTVTGYKNLLDISYWTLGGISDTGSEVISTTNARCTNYIPVNPNTTYILCSALRNGNLRLNEYTSTKSHI